MDIKMYSISQGSSITGTSPSDSLKSYLRYLLGKFHPSAEMQSVYSAAPADCTVLHSSLSDSKWTQVSKVLIRILANLSKFVVSMVSARLPISNSTSHFNKPFRNRSECIDYNWYSSSSSSSCRAASTDIPDTLSPLLPIIHCLRLVFRATSLLYVCMFELIVLLLLGHMRGSIEVHHLWARPCFSCSVLHVWFV